MTQSMTIVFNGAPTLRTCLKNAAQFVDRLLVVEGATAENCWSSTDGRSIDDTNDILDELKVTMGDKMVLIRKNGFWDDKLAMCAAAEPMFEDGLLWQIDSDEFFEPGPARAVAHHVSNSDHTEAEFWGYHFFGSTQWHMPLVPSAWGNRPPWRRLFKIQRGDKWKSHAPPRLDRTYENVLDRDQTAKMEAHLFHYGYLWRPQVAAKMIQHAGISEIMRKFEDAASGAASNVEIEGLQLQKFSGRHPVDVREFEG